MLFTDQLPLPDSPCWHPPCATRLKCDWIVIELLNILYISSLLLLIQKNMFFTTDSPQNLSINRQLESSLLRKTEHSCSFRLLPSLQCDFPYQTLLCYAKLHANISLSTFFYWIIFMITETLSCSKRRKEGGDAHLEWFQKTIFSLPIFPQWKLDNDSKFW